MTLQRQVAPQTQAKPASTGGVLQRTCACGQHTGNGGECEACRKKRESTLQRAAISSPPVGAAPPIVHEVLRSPGQPLEVTTRAFMEPRFGHDFSGVRVHTDAKAAESARAVNALAYTVGRDVVFGLGQYAPGTSAGNRLLAHELAHTIQQTGDLKTALSIGQLGDRYEREADYVSQIVMAGHLAPKIASVSPFVIQRKVSAQDEIDWERTHPEGRVDEKVEGGRTMLILWNFAVGSDELKPDHRKKLLTIAQHFQGAFEEFVLEIEGHTSSLGSEGRNKAISENRANAAKVFLATAGMARVVTKALGETAPWFPNTTAENMAKNRRVEIRSKKQKELPTKTLEAADCAARIANVNIVTLGAQVIRQPAPDAPQDLVQVTLNDHVSALGTAELIGGTDCEKFTFGFFQIARAGYYKYTVYHSPKINKDIKLEDDLSAMPALDVSKKGEIWYTSEPPKCQRGGRSNPVEVLLTDKPSQGYLNGAKAGIYPKSFVWYNPFLTIFSVLCPDGSVRHLKSFLWTIHYCEQFAAPAAGEALGKSLKRSSSVEIEGVRDGAPNEPGLALAGKPATRTANEIIKTAPSKTEVYGELDVIC